MLSSGLSIAFRRVRTDQSPSDVQFKTSVAVTNLLVSLLISRNSCYTREVKDSQHSAKAKLCSLNHQQRLDHRHKFQESAPSALSCSIDISREPGASTWLSALPLRDHQFHLHKGDFVIPSACDMAGCQLYYRLPVCVVSPFLLSMP